MNKTIYVRDINVWEHAIDLAWRQHISMSELIYRAIADYVKKHGKEQ